MATLVILRGLPASGKSTFARTYAGEHENTVIVSLDGLRRMMAGSLTAYHEHRTEKTEKLVVRTAHTMICDALRKGMNVVMDAQNASAERVHELVRLAADCNADVQTVAFPVPLDTLLERNRHRAKDDRVPEDYLRSQYERFADNIATPMRWVRVPVAPAGRNMWRPSEHGRMAALIDAEAAYRMAQKPLSVETFRMVEAFLPSKHGRNNTNMLRVPESDDPRTLFDPYDEWLRHGAPNRQPDDTTHPEAEPTLLDHMRANPNVHVKPVQGETDLYACNFTRDAFRNHAWDEYSSKARGLFLNSAGDVEMRGFDKFFNIGENKETSLQNVLDRMEYPVRIETKENGFLGLVGAREDGTLRYFSKAGNTNYSPLVKRLMHGMVDDATLCKLARLIRDHNVTLAFEVVDTDSDRHIIAYNEPRLYFLHAIRNQRHFEIAYDVETKVQELCGFNRPPIYSYARSAQDLQVMVEQLERNRQMEGGVIYGANGYMVKVKSSLYLASKRLRPVLESILLHGKPVPQDDSERSRLVRTVLDTIPRERLIYHQTAFDKDAVDMTQVTAWLQDRHGKETR